MDAGPDRRGARRPALPGISPQVYWRTPLHRGDVALLRLRTASFALVCATAVACSGSQPTPALAGRVSSGAAPAPSSAVVLGTFRGALDPATGKLTIQTIETIAPGALTVFDPVQDGTAGSGPDDTLELVTETALPYDPVGAVSNGCAAGVDSFEGNITLRSFYTKTTHWNVYIQLTDVTSGFEACNSSPAFGGLRNDLGLWKYGTIGPKGHAAAESSVRWKFDFSAGTAFTFKGRILAMPGPEFDWKPAMLATHPARKFQEVSTTIGHFEWDGIQFVDKLGNGVVFTRVGALQSGSLGIVSTPDPYADFSNGSHYIASAGPGGNADAIDTSGDFTVCARFKPGTHPSGLNYKVVVGKGRAAELDADRGWALGQSNELYEFRYRTSVDLSTPDPLSYLSPGWDGTSINTTAPGLWAFDYICGGRNSTTVLVGAHGKYSGAIRMETGTLSEEPALPLVIGAFANGDNALSDGGLFEVILDSRPVSAEVMNEIVSLAEGRTLANQIQASFQGSATGAPSGTYLEPFWLTTPVTGADSNIYQLAPHLTVPLTLDAGSIPTTQWVEYSRPFTADSRLTGYCVGAVVAADAGWYDTGAGKPIVKGTVLEWGSQAIGDGWLGVYDGWGLEVGVPGGPFAATGFDGWGSWASGSAHGFLGCVDANAATNRKIQVWIDGAWETDIALPPTANVGDPGVAVGIGNPYTSGYRGEQFVNGRIKRVIFCPSSDPALCCPADEPLLCAH
jgi:hypothetical protein